MRVDELPKLTRKNARAMLKAGQQSRKIANNTTLHWDRKGYYVILHDSVIMSVDHVDGHVEINTHGWNTKTTISRLDTMLGGYAFKRANYRGEECNIERWDGTVTTGNKQTFTVDEFESHTPYGDGR